MSDLTNRRATTTFPFIDASAPGHGRFMGASVACMDSYVEAESQTPTVRQLLNLIGALGAGGLAVVTWDSGLWPLTIACWLVGGHFMHTFALSFHDAAHGTLHPDERINECLGFLYGTMILVPLTVYRRAHAYHHAKLASVDDPELYPFVIPGTSRAFRITCVIAETLLGYVYTPLLFARFAWIDQKMSHALRRQVIVEYAVIISMIAITLATVVMTGQSKFYLIGLLAPALVGGAYQTLRKYTEHLGLLGASILESTRSILPRNQVNCTISSLVQHVDHHGTHHIHAKIPYFELPQASEQVYKSRGDTLPVYHSYAAAFWAMLMTVTDPKIGAQWREH